MTLENVGRASVADSVALNSRWIILLTANSFKSRGIYYLLGKEFKVDSLSVLVFSQVSAG
jgi:hypothetical protein